ncbi:NAD(P)H-hydrate dehydratase [soil metagenome]
MRAAEAAAFARGITAGMLMDEAAGGIAASVRTFFPRPGRCVVFAGTGNNAGDVIAAAELLSRDGWDIDLRLAFPENKCGELPRKMLAALRATMGRAKPAPPTGGTTCTIILDGLLGVGGKPPLREPILAACREINRLRREEGAFVYAADGPSGIDSDSGEADADCVRADVTAAIGFVKQGLLSDRATDLVGRIEVLPLKELRPLQFKTISVTGDRAAIRDLLPRRNFLSHKNQFGRVGIVAGSRGLTGAAVLCSLGALRAGAGLFELFVTDDVYPILAAAAAPEVMVKPVDSYRSLTKEPIDVWGVGSGLGREHSAEIIRFIESTAAPIVLDADALNMLAGKMRVLQRSSAPRLLTPHPGEMKRLFPAEGMSRSETAAAFTAKYSATLLFKGSRTIVAETGKPMSYNTTGNPGMATGGMGDVLTGVCAALIAQKLSLYDAARMGAWLCGRAAEIAIFAGNASEESLLPTDVLANLGSAFRELR